MASGKTIGLWIITVLPALMFLATGAMKLMGLQVEQFQDWGYPGWFSYVIGVVELLGGAALLWPKSAPYAADVLVVDMIGATVTHIVHAEWMVMAMPFVLGVLVAIAGWARRPEWVRDLMAKRGQSSGL